MERERSLGRIVIILFYYNLHYRLTNYRKLILIFIVAFELLKISIEIINDNFWQEGFISVCYQ